MTTTQIWRARRIDPSESRQEDLVVRIVVLKVLAGSIFLLEIDREHDQSGQLEQEDNCFYARQVGTDEPTRQDQSEFQTERVYIVTEPTSRECYDRCEQIVRID